MSPAGTDRPALSPIAEDYLKAIWSATEWGGLGATTKGLAERFGTTAATVSDTIKRLTAQGLVTHQPYRAIGLTTAGERQALMVVRRHRLLETFLVEILGYDWAEVHDEAERLEHATSELMIERIATLLGDPDHDPHGDPIPSAHGTIEHPSTALRLAEADPGEYRVLRVSDADPGRLGYFADLGVTPAAEVRVAARDEYAGTVEIVTAQGGKALAGAAAGAVIVVPVDTGRPGQARV